MAPAVHLSILHVASMATKGCSASSQIKSSKRSMKISHLHRRRPKASAEGELWSSLHAFLNMQGRLDWLGSFLAFRLRRRKAAILLPAAIPALIRTI